jgi:hypothetical protein
MGNRREPGIKELLKCFEVLEGRGDKDPIDCLSYLISLRMETIRRFKFKLQDISFL